MAQQVLQILKDGASAHQSDKFRKANTVFLPADADVIVSGDLHGNRRNFERIVSLAKLYKNPNTHIILQELIHGGPEDDSGGCLSFQLLIDAVKLKIEYPDNVHFLLGNHDTAFISRSEVMKNGKEMNQSMRDAMKRYFKKESENIDLEMARLLFAQPLAIMCPNRIMISHSLPADRLFEKFEPGILNRHLKVNDIVRPQSAYLFTWGRRQSPEVINKLAGIFDVDTFIVGHQSQPTGFDRYTDKMLIIASDHSHGVVVRFNCSKKYSIDELISCILPLASIA
jgi:hypothetical protein